LEALKMAASINPYFPILIAFVLGLLIAGGATIASFVLGPKKPNPAKLDVYECGVPVVGTARQRLSVKFYLTAILFILFDIETVFLYLWAVLFDELQWFGIIEVGLFVGTLIVGYVYILRRGALDWD
jgi:NADH-quinone oxidoreductase subunit A